MSDQLIAAWRRVADRPDGPPSLRIDRSALLGLVEAAEQLRDERDEARATARRLADALAAMSCQNCDDRKCMSCVFREHHAACTDDCPDCCPLTNVHSPFTARYVQRADAINDYKQQTKDWT